jgi:hypothetical protein
VKFRGWLAMRVLFSALLRAGVVVAVLFVAIPSRAADGFYLVAPPAVPSGAAGGNAVNLSAPLSSWERRGFYDASAACFSALNAYRIETRSRLQGSPEAGSAVALLEQTRAEHTRCVYANDPRLK